MRTGLQSCFSKTTVLTVIAVLTIGLGTALSDGIWLGRALFQTEHHGGGAPDHPNVVVQLPGDNWSSFRGVDLANATVRICVRFTVTGLQLARECEEVSPCWPIIEDWDSGKVKVVVKDRQTNRNLTRLVAKYRDGETGWACKEISASKMEGVSSVLFKSNARQIPKREAKLFMETMVYKPADPPWRRQAANGSASGFVGPGIRAR